MLRRARILALIPLLGLAACGGSGADHRAHVTETRSSAPRASASAPGGDVRAQAAADDAFGGRLYKTLAPDQKTFAVSPFSIAQALAMTSAGARGPTLQQLRAALGFALPPDRLHAAVNALDQALLSRTQDRVQLDVANSLWGQTGLRFEPAFLDTLARDYGAGMQVVDYRRDPEAGRVAINSWVSAHTHAKIPSLLPHGSLGFDTRLVLVNAVYLKADWATPFEAGRTGSAPFHAPGGDVTAKFMHRDGQIDYARGDGYQAVELPYRGDQLAMDLILPDVGELAAIEARLASGGVAPLLGGLHPAAVSLALPKLDLTSQFDLADALARLGAHDLFTDRADLSGMTTKEALRISKVVHEVKLTVDEKGTEAAAATAPVAVATSALAPPPIPFTLDRPFLLAVRDKATGEVLFLARVLSP
jgi:serpin B